MADMSNSTAMVSPEGGNDLLALDGDDSVADEKQSGFSATLGNVDVLRQLTIIMALAICLAIAVFVIMWINQPEYRILTKLPTQELIETMDFLDANKVDYKQESNIISVRNDEYQQIKLMLAREGLNQEPDQGTDIIMKDMGFGVSQRMETERLKHGRELQLARTIEQLQKISRAKVLLAIPRENVFARKQRAPPLLLW